MKQVAEDAPGFFDCAIEKIGATDIPFKTYWISLLSQSRILKVKFPLGNASTEAQFARQDFPYYSDASGRFEPKFEFALGAYDKGVLWVQNVWPNTL